MVVTSVDVEVKVPVHGSVVVLIRPSLVGVLITITVSSVGKPLVPVTVVISVDVEVKVPVHGSVVVVIKPSLVGVLMTITVSSVG